METRKYEESSQKLDHALNAESMKGPDLQPTRLKSGRIGSATAGSHVQSILQMQRRFGNRHVQRTLELARKGDGAAEVSSDVESGIERERGGGQAMDSHTQRQMESAFGADFSGVRIHTGAESHSLNRAVNAVAFTTGSDIFFSDGAYAPGNSSGRELLAHELTHVVQQGAADTLPEHHRSAAKPACSSCLPERAEKEPQAKLAVGAPDDEYEQEAERVGRIVAGQMDNASGPPRQTPAVQRECSCGTQEAGECEKCRMKRQDGTQCGMTGGLSGLQRSMENEALSVWLQRRVVCPEGVSEEEGTGCYEVDDEASTDQSTTTDQDATTSGQTTTSTDQGTTTDDNDTNTNPGPLMAATIHPEEDAAKEASEDPNIQCEAIIHHIEELIEQLIGRYNDLVDHGGGDEGHRERYEEFQRVLKTLMTRAEMECKNGEYDSELQEEASKQANRPLPRIAMPEESFSWETVAQVVVALGLSIALVATIVAALADPEPFSKLALAGLTAEEITALSAALGITARVAQ